MIDTTQWGEVAAWRQMKDRIEAWQFRVVHGEKQLPEDTPQLWTAVTVSAHNYSLLEPKGSCTQLSLGRRKYDCVLEKIQKWKAYEVLDSNEYNCSVCYLVLYFRLRVI